jgi:hypothetical protein
MQSSEEKKLRSDIDELKEELMRLEKTTDPANQTAMQIMLAKHQQLTAMQQQLAAIRQKEVLLMQGEQA